jgi:hypothetical protein
LSSQKVKGNMQKKLGTRLYVYIHNTILDRIGKSCTFFPTFPLMKSNIHSQNKVNTLQKTDTATTAQVVGTQVVCECLQTLGY